MPLGFYRGVAGIGRRFVPTGRTPNTITVTGDTKISTAASQFGGASAFFDGNQDWLTISGGLQPITGDFSIQFWFNVSAKPVSGYRTLFSQNLTFQPNIFFNSGSLACNFEGISFSLGTNYNVGWNYFHFYRTAGVCRAQCNSSFSSTASISNTLFPSGSQRISLGSEGSTSFNDYFNGYIDEVRVSNVFRGTTVPTSAFTNDANTFLLLHMDGANNSTTFTDDISPPPKAIGGTVSDITVDGINYRTHRFTATGNSTFTVNEPLSVDILLIGGGSSGSKPNGTYGGGGGASGVLRRNYSVPVTAQNYTITVGAGGAARTTGGTGVAGAASSGLGFTANGGLSSNSSYSNGSDVTQQGRRNDDFAGGVMNDWFSGAAGGAGAGQAGENASNTSGTGGSGATDSNFTTTSTTYGGGGSGGLSTFTGGDSSSGGSGGGGRGSSDAFSRAATAGATNSGSGGGGGSPSRASGAGGSGIVIIRYQI
jgi:hypothetical protein